MDSAALDNALHWLAGQQDAMTEDLIALCNMNSGSDNLDGLMRVASWLENWAGFTGTTFERVAMPARQIVTDRGDVQTHETGPLLRWDFGADKPLRVLLCIHYDTVFPADHAFQSCESMESDRLRGPGVADAKGGILVLRNALCAAQQFGLLDGIGFSVVLNPDEEVGSLSSAEYLQSIASEFRLGLLFEPALPTGELVSQRKGSGNFDVVVRGRAAHAGRHFDEGRNAIAALCRIFGALDALNGQRDGLTINLGFVQGGGPVNVVPDLAVGRLNIRVADQEGSAWVQARLNEIVAAAQAEEGYEVLLHGGITSPPKSFDEPAQRVGRLVEEATAHVQQFAGEQLQPIRWKPTGGVCDGNKLAGAGLPNIDTLGPIGDGLHSDQEWVQVTSLPRKAQVITTLLARLSADHSLFSSSK